jgi:hypothetical protein
MTVTAYLGFGALRPSRPGRQLQGGGVRNCALVKFRRVLSTKRPARRWAYTCRRFGRRNHSLQHRPWRWDWSGRRGRGCNCKWDRGKCSGSSFTLVDTRPRRRRSGCQFG